MAAKYILAGFAALFLTMSLLQREPWNPQRRAWLVVGAIFGGVSVWLFFAI